MIRTRKITNALAAVAVLTGPAALGTAALAAPTASAVTASGSSSGFTLSFPAQPSFPTFPSFPTPPTFPSFPPAAPAPPPIDTSTNGTTSIVTELAPGGENNDGTFDINEFDYHITALLVQSVLAADPHGPVSILADGTRRATFFQPDDEEWVLHVCVLQGPGHSSAREDPELSDHSGDDPDRHPARAGVRLPGDLFDRQRPDSVGQVGLRSGHARRQQSADPGFWHRRSPDESGKQADRLEHRRPTAVVILNPNHVAWAPDLGKRGVRSWDSGIFAVLARGATLPLKETDLDYGKVGSGSLLEPMNPMASHNGHNPWGRGVGESEIRGCGPALL